MSQSTSSSGPNATPSRERLHFPPSSHPSPAQSSYRAVSSASLPQPPPASNNTSSATVEMLLKLHASAPDTKLAALDQAVNERNVLSAQNSQLWKLIEKQRAGYTQILKELERVRGERDAFKSKLGAIAAGQNGSHSGHSEKARKSVEKERSARHATNESHPSTSSHPPHPREAITRGYSDDQPSLRTQHHQSSLHPSRSYEPLAPDRNLQSNSSSSSLTPNHTLPPPPASAPNPSMPLMGSPSSQGRKDTSLSFAVPPRVDSALPTSLPVTEQANTTTARPLRKSSLAEKSHQNRNPGYAAPPVSNVNYGISPQIPPSHSHQYTHLSQYQGRSSGSSNDQPINGLHLQEIPSVHILTSPATPTQSQASSSPTKTNMLSAIVEPRPPHLLSRESQISLPDEARQYITNMGESPMNSPKVNVFVTKPGGHTGQYETNQGVATDDEAVPVVDGASRSESPVPTHEFLDMEDTLPEEEDEDDVDETTVEGYESMDSSVLSPQITPPEFQQNQPSTPQFHAHGRKSKARAAPEDFPLPPPNPLLIQQTDPQAQSMAQTKGYAQSMTAADSASQHQMGSVPPSTGYPSSETFTDSNSSHPPPPPQSAQHNQRHEQYQAVPASFRALPLLSSDLPRTIITVSHSFVRPNDRGKEVLSFIVYVNPGQGKDGWKVEKMYSDVLGLDQRVRNSVGKGVGKRIANLPEGKLWKDHAPAKVDQRKAVLEKYLQTLINLPIKNNDEVIAFFTSDVVREAKQPVMQAGHKEGYLTKRGKNFGGWKTRYFVLQGPVLEYYDCRGGAHLGSITVTGAQIGRQQRSERTTSTDEEKEYRHAFLIVEAKKGPGGNHPRHVLCAESDDDRDSWVEMLVRYFSGTYSEEISYGPSSSTSNPTASQISQPRSSTSSNEVPRRAARGMSKDDISISKGAAIPISQLPQDSGNAKLFQTAPLSTEAYARSSSPSKSIEPSPTDRQTSNGFLESQSARRVLERSQGQPSSLPDSSILSNASPFPSEPLGPGQRANSELGHYPDLQDQRTAQSGWSQRQLSPERHRPRDTHNERKSFHPTLNTVTSSPTTHAHSDRVPSPEKLDLNGKVKISGPLNGAPIPSGFKFGGKEAPSETSAAASDRREKAKSRSFWGFGKANGYDKSQLSAIAYTPRAVFGVNLEEALDVAQIANLPAIVFRAIQFLEANKADQEEGIYRLNGSSAVIKSLKDRFNREGDVDLLASDEFWDPHAIAGLLKSFLRELPASILTRELHLRFLAVIDFVDPQERIRELSQLIAALPIANYTLLRALTAHLILIVQNSNVNKMTMRNVGIVFSPTLGIPAGVFSLMLGEFNRVFNVDAGNEEAGRRDVDNSSDQHSNTDRRNSRQYSDAAADQLLGLSGRCLTTPSEEVQSDGDDSSVQDESGTETTEFDATAESFSESSPSPTSVSAEHRLRATPPDTPTASRAAHVAASRGINITVTQSDRGNRYSRMISLPSSPRPPQSPSSTPEVPSSSLG